MFGSIRRHQNWIWVVVVSVVSVSMVAFFTSDYGIRSLDSNRGDFGSIGGERITREEYLEALREAQLSAYIRSGGREWPAQDAETSRQLEQQALFRAFIIRKLQEMHIQPSKRAIGMAVHERIGEMPYDTFEKDYLMPHGVTGADFQRFMEHEAGQQQLMASAGISTKLVSPRDAEALFRKENEETHVELAVFWSTNFLEQVTVTLSNVLQYYTNMSAMYKIPARLQVSYVEFPATNYFSEADALLEKNKTNVDNVVSQVYVQRNTNDFLGTNGLELPEAETKAKIRERIRKNEALMAARRAASEFGNQLYSHPNPTALANFAALAASNKYPVQASPPFDYQKGLEDTEFPPELKARAFSLSDAAPIAFSPIPGSNAVYVIARKGFTQSEDPPLEKIQDKVTADYKNAQAMELARKAGQAFHTALTNGLAQKKTWAEICAAEKVQPLVAPPFAPSTESLTNLDARVNFGALRNTADPLKPGEASEFIISGAGGHVVYLQGRSPVAAEKIEKELPTFIGRLRQYRQNEAFNRWFSEAAKKAQLTAPKREESAAPPATRVMGGAQ